MLAVGIGSHGDRSTKLFTRQKRCYDGQSPLNGRYFKRWCVCVHVCMCVCLYLSTVKVSSDCKMSETYLRGTDICVVNIYLGTLPGSCISVTENVTFHLQSRNSSSSNNWRENDTDIIRARDVDIGCKSLNRQVTRRLP